MITHKQYLTVTNKETPQKSSQGIVAMSSGDSESFSRIVESTMINNVRLIKDQCANLAASHYQRLGFRACLWIFCFGPLSIVIARVITYYTGMSVNVVFEYMCVTAIISNMLASSSLCLGLGTTIQMLSFGIVLICHNQLSEPEKTIIICIAMTAGGLLMSIMIYMFSDFNNAIDSAVQTLSTETCPNDEPRVSISIAPKSEEIIANENAVTK